MEIADGKNGYKSSCNIIKNLTKKNPVYFLFSTFLSFRIALSTDGDKYAFVNAQVKAPTIYRLMCTTCILESMVLEGEREEQERGRDCAKNK